MPPSVFVSTNGNVLTLPGFPSFSPGIKVLPLVQVSVGETKLFAASYRDWPQVAHLYPVRAARDCGAFPFSPGAARRGLVPPISNTLSLDPSSMVVMCLGRCKQGTSLFGQISISSTVNHVPRTTISVLVPTTPHNTLYPLKLSGKSSTLSRSS